MWFFSDDERAVQQVARQLAQKELAPCIQRIDREEGFNREAFRKMGDAGLLGLVVPTVDGGAGLGAVAATLAMEELSAVDASTTLSYLAHLILCVNQIARNGSPAQKTRYLPKLISGEWLGGMGMSEPEAGSDALGMKTRAILRGRHYILNGSKTWITNGPVGDVFYCYARTSEGRKELTSFIIERGLSGFSSGKKFEKLGMRASPTGELVFDQCRVPLENRVGEENQSLAAMMRNLDLERITIAGISLGLARAAIETATRYSRERCQFGRPIGSFQQIQAKLAETSSWFEACRALTYSTAKAWDEGRLTAREASLAAARAKLQSAQMATHVALEAIQILGGYGYTREFPVERYLRDAKLMEIGAGTNEILRLVIARQMLGEAATSPAVAA
ncbi:MAG: acyl-CoA dehydrogenase family protein [Oligoflexia bacterium]|nr:acyl-CoA dehydrogenase family protein [Oligoflexia bacterium]